MPTPNLPHFDPGETVVLRYITRTGSLPGMSWPFRVVEDREDLVALYIPAGAQYARWGRPAEPGLARTLQLDGWRRDVLRLMFPGRQHSVWLFWEREEAGRRFTAYYVNMEEPFRRTPIGFDTNDHALDIVVQPDLTWRWKDEEEFEGLVASGQYSAGFGESVRAEALRAVEAIEGRLAPFGDGWERWAPDPSWEPPTFPEGWTDVPVAIWEQRDWAYRG